MIPCLFQYRVGLFSGKTGALVRGVSRFGSVAHSGVLRGDGRLLAAGQDTGVVQVFDAASKDVLRVFKGHAGPVQAVAFGSDNTHLASAGDDCTTRLWDLSSGQVVAEFGDHTDYVRSLDTSPASPFVWLTGSYDHSVRLWDARASGGANAAATPAPAHGAGDAGGAVMTMKHGAPVTAVLMLRGGMACVTAGGPLIKVWDLSAGGRLLTTVQSHAKLVTCLCLDGTGDRVLSGGLDHVVNVYNHTTWETAHSLHHDAPGLSVGVSPSNTQLVVGDTASNLTVRTRDVSAAGAALRTL